MAFGPVSRQLRENETWENWTVETYYKMRMARDAELKWLFKETPEVSACNYMDVSEKSGTPQIIPF